MKRLLRSSLVAALCGVAFLSIPGTAQMRQLVDNQSRGASGTAGGAPRDLKAVPAGLAKTDWQSIRAAYEAGRYAFQPIEGGWQARNPGQQWITKFDGRGFVAEPKDGGWQWGLELQSYGFGENQDVISDVPAVKVDGQRLSYQWDAVVQEWFVNDARGLEHGFTVKERPPQAPSSTSQHSALNCLHGAADFSPSLESQLVFTLTVRGTLAAQAANDGQAVEFRETAGATVINYAGLKVWDADGKVLASRFEPVGEKAVRLVVDERGARYPLTIDPIAQQAYLKPAAVGTTQAVDQFGTSVAVSGDTVVVGAPYEASNAAGVNSTPNEGAIKTGAAYVFVRKAGGWMQQAYLKPAVVGSVADGEFFGTSVAISGDTVVVGADHEDSDSTGVNSTPNDNAFGSGAAYVFVRNAGVWTQQAYLKPAAVGTTQAGDSFGRSVAVSGNTVVVGTPGEDSSSTGVNSSPNDSGTFSHGLFFDFNSGAAYVFVRNAGVWTQQAYLKPAAVGTTQRGDSFGTSVAVSGDTVVVGAQYEDSSTTGVNSTPNDTGTPDFNGTYYFNSGAAYVFARSGATWTQQAYLKPAAVGTSQFSDLFGDSVAVSGDTVVVGAHYEDSSTTGVNSTPNDPVEANYNSGAAYVFVRSAGVWMQQAYLKPAAVGATQAGDQFGFSVAVSGDVVVAGARGEDSSTTGVNSTPNESDSGPVEPYESVTGPGAAYVFVRSAGVWTQHAYLKPAAVGTSQANDFLGFSVAVSGDTVVVGARLEDSSTTGVNSTPNESATGSGAAYIFTLAAIDNGDPFDGWFHGNARGVALDAAGNRYVAGFFFGEVDFNPGIELEAKTSAGDADLFVTRFNADGTYAWTRTFGGSASDSANAIAVSNTAVYVAGTFSSTDAVVANAGGTDAIVLAFDAATGARLTSFGKSGAQTFGGTGDDEATGIAVAGKRLLVCGAFASTDATIGGAGAFPTTGSEDAFVLALDISTGKRIRDFGQDGVQTLAGLDVEHATALSLSGRTLFVSGYALPNSTGVGNLGSVFGRGGLDAFVLALDRRTGAPRRKFGTGGLQFIGGTRDDLALGLAVANGGVYAVGTFESDDAGVGGLGEARSVGGFDAFVAALNASTGAAHPFFGMSGMQTFGGSNDDTAAALVASGTHMHVAGEFTSGNAGIDGDFGTLASGGGADAFVLELDAFTGGAFDFAPVTFGGSNEDAAFAIAAAGNAIFAVGSSFSSDAGFGGSGMLDATPWNGFVLELAGRANDAASLRSGDVDGDEFPDEVEASMGTSPEVFMLSPAGFDAGPAGPLIVRSLTIKLDFTAPDPELDKVILRGSVPIPAGFSPAGQPVAVAVGGAVRRFVLDSFGVAATSEGSFALTVKRNAAGEVLAQDAKFLATFKHCSLRAQLDDERLTGEATIASPGEPRRVAAIVMLGGDFFREDVIAYYTAVAAQSGLAVWPLNR